MNLKEIEKIMTNAETINRIAEQLGSRKTMSWIGIEANSLRIQRLADEILSITEKEHEKKRL